ncbi:uncharacterized protein ACA1_146640 [Acanthamoeba castellanii str. Neff]|uniref:Right handed beta helix domain-containing protein n=1 Tax=Acanthamoeba castellanii (strain ATCC 30010 / Neff) TaxID=1257118 RepID=L8GU41_ACACF|nr:uncharacterized protein ACA1_146640 [Acanthamoeba castellanii str. Neff]ELR16530.1 hypothetical protein ACA1_146640 [Acanthamoeba castellanii str. Neff]
MASQLTLLEVADCLFRNNSANPASFSTGALLAQILTARRSLGKPPSVLISQRNTFISNAGGAVDAVRVLDYDVYSSGDVFQNNGVVDTNPVFSMANTLYTLTLAMEDAVFERNRGLAVGANVDSASFTNCRFIGNNGGIVPYTSDNTTVTGSVFIANTYGIDVQDLAPINMTVENTVIVGNLQFGVRAGNNSIAVFTNSSVYRNGFQNVSGSAVLNDVLCGLSDSSVVFNADPNLCTTGTENPCTAGLDQCGRCAGGNVCLDCSGAAYGEATLSFCDSLTTLGAAPAANSTYWLELEFQGDSPNALIYPVVNGAAQRALSVVVNYTTLEVSNSSAANSVALMRQNVDEIAFKRSRSDLANLEGVMVSCTTFEGVAANGGFITINQCLLQDGVTVSPVNGINVALPSFSLKIDLGFSYWKGRGIGADGDRHVRLSLDVVLQQEAALLAGVRREFGGNGSALLESTESVLQGASYFSAVSVLNFFLADDLLVVGPAPSGGAGGGQGVRTSIKPAGPTDPRRHLLALEFQGDFDEALYDPNVGLLLGQYREDGGSGDDLLLVKILVPALVGGALVLVVGTVIVAVTIRWALWHRIYGGSGQVNFQGDDL